MLKGGIVSSQLKIYGLVPPVGAAATTPSHIPHVALVVDKLGRRGNGSTIVILSNTEHPLKSETVTTQVPGQSPVAEEVVCARGSLHK